MDQEMARSVMCCRGSIPRTHLKEPGVMASACNLSIGKMAETVESRGSLDSLLELVTYRVQPETLSQKPRWASSEE